MQRHLVAPSVLSADFARMAEVLQMLEKSSADWIHWDVMDGCFVPNITFGMDFIRALRPYSGKFFDVHLMIENPAQYIETFARAGANGITIHWEADRHLHRTVSHIKDLGLKAGIAINPATPVNILEDIVSHLDLILIMSVNPGFGGQKFIQQTYKKLNETRQMLERNASKALIQVDGGVSAENAHKLIDEGADVLVAGSFIFNSPDPVKAIELLKNI